MGDPLEQVPRRLAIRLKTELSEFRARLGLPLAVVVDGARVRGTAALLARLEAPFVSLYRGDAESELAHVAPYLAQLDPEGRVWLWLTMIRPALEASLILASSAPLPDLRTHLRRFLMVRDASGASRYFRLHDPRVLTPLLEASNDTERAQVFGPIAAFMAFDPAAVDDPARQALVVWEAPTAQPSNSAAKATSPPDLHNPFSLRVEHENAFRRDMQARYEHRLFDYLRGQYPQRFGASPDSELRGAFDAARELAPRLGVVAGKDLSILTELLCWRDAEFIERTLNGVDPHRRLRALWTLTATVRAAQQAAVGMTAY